MFLSSHETHHKFLWGQDWMAEKNNELSYALTRKRISCLSLRFSLIGKVFFNRNTDMSCHSGTDSRSWVVNWGVERCDVFALKILIPLKCYTLNTQLIDLKLSERHQCLSTQKSQFTYVVGPLVKYFSYDLNYKITWEKSTLFSIWFRHWLHYEK